jgi:ubiquinone/menaquinone biosynthesis C-methylase UbiE
LILNHLEDAMNLQAVREDKRDEWTLSAVGWVAYRANFTDASVPSAARMVELAQLSPGQRVLDLACGVGVPAFDLAQAVGPQGYVLGLDFAEAMVEGAREWAKERNATNVEFRTIPSEYELGVPAAGFDAATCRAGLQYMPEPGPALKAMHEALKPGGRMVAMTIGSPERCTSLRVLEEVVARHVDVAALIPPPDPTVPGTVSISKPEILEEFFTAAGFTDVKTEVADYPIVQAENPEVYWELCERSAGPFIRLLTWITDEQRRAIREDAINELGAMFPDSMVRMTGETLITVGVKAG